MGYTRDLLLQMRDNKNTVPLDWNTLRAIRNEGLATTLPTNRGTSAGRNKWFPIGTQINVRDNSKLTQHKRPPSVIKHIPLLPMSNEEKPKQPLKLCVINCQSTRNKADLLVDYVLENDFDLIAMSETWLKTGNDDRKIKGDITPDGYKLISIPRVGRRGGGIALLYKKTLSVTSVTDETTTAFESLSVCVISGSKTLRLVIIYRLIPYQKRGPKRSDFFMEFSNLIDKFVLMPGAFMITGDFNIHWDIEMDTGRRHLNDLIVSANLKQHVTETTHRDGHILDLVITRSDDSCIRSLSLPSMFSDHAAIHIDLNMCKPRRPQRTIIYRKFKAIDSGMLSDDINRSELLKNPSTTLDGALSQYDKVIRSVIHKHAPLKTHTRVLRPTVPWFTDEISEAKRVLRQHERKWRRTRLTVHRQIFQHQRLHLRNLIDANRASYFNSKITQSL